MDDCIFFKSPQVCKFNFANFFAKVLLLLGVLFWSNFYSFACPRSIRQTGERLDAAQNGELLLCEWRQTKSGSFLRKIHIFFYIFMLSCCGETDDELMECLIKTFMTCCRRETPIKVMKTSINHSSWSEWPYNQAGRLSNKKCHIN